MAKTYILSVLMMIVLYNQASAQCPNPIPPPTIITSIDSTESICASSGTLTIHATTGAPALIYAITAGPELRTNQSDSMFQGLQSGSYTVRVTDACGQETFDTVSVPGAYIIPDYTPVAIPETCPGSNTGSIDVNITGGRSPYDYYLISPSPVIDSNLNVQSDTFTFDSLPPGAYRIQVIDSCDNIQTRDVILNPSIHSGLTLFGVRSQLKIGCDTIEFDFVTRSYVGPVTVEINVGTDTMRITDSTAVPNGEIGGAVFIGKFYAPYGTHSYRVYDGCGDTLTGTLTFNPFVILRDILPDTCNENPGVRVEINSHNMCFPADYWVINTSVMPPDTISMGTATGPNSGPWFYETIEDLDAGLYKLVVEDCCGTLDSFFQTVDSLPTPEIVRVTNLPRAACDSTGNIWIRADFMTEPFTVNILSGPASWQSVRNDLGPATFTYPITFTDVLKSPNQSIHMLNMPVGDYEIELIDDCGNIDTAVFTLDRVKTYDPTVTVISGCVDAHSLVYEVGVDTFYGWTGGWVYILRIYDSVGSLVSQPPAWNVPPNSGINLMRAFIDTFRIDNLPADTYVFELTSNPWRYTTSIEMNPTCTFPQILRDTVVIDPYIPIEIGAAIAINCLDTGVIIITASQGTAPYTYAITNGPVTRGPQSSPIFDSLPSGTYMIQVLDACLNSVEVEVMTGVLQPPNISSLSICSDSLALDGSIVLSADSIFGASYAWTGPNGFIDSARMITISDFDACIDPGLYTVTVIAFDCDTVMASINILDPCFTLPPPDTLSIKMCIGDSISFCFDSLLQLTCYQADTTYFCIDTGATGIIEMLVNGDTCISIVAPTDLLSTTSNICVTSCYIIGIDTIYDTTTIIVTVPLSPPVPDTILADITVACDDDIPDTLLLTAVGFCGDTIMSVVSDSIADGSMLCDNQFVLIRTYTFTDSCGNDTSCIQTIVVQDTISPVLSCPADMTINCPGDTLTSTTGMAMGTEGCTAAAIISYRDSVIAGNCRGAFTLYRIWTAADSCGNETSCIQTIVVQDTTPPTFTFFPADTTLDCPADTMVATLGMPMAADLCNPVVNITHVDDVTPGACPNTFTLLRIWTATDGCGLIAIDTQTVIVQDTTPPTFTFFPADTTLDCPADTMVATIGKPMATDLCNPMVIITHVDDVTPGACPNTFTLLRIWTATDSCGLIAIDTQTVIVQDTTPPTFTFFPADTTLDCPADTMVATLGMPMATDLCNPVVIITHVDDVTPGACPNTFTLLRIWTATDSCGLIAIDTQTVIVQDTTPPTFTFFPADTTLDCPADTMVATLGMPMATDLCNPVVIITHVDDVTPGACPNTFTLLRIWTAIDSCGLIAIDTQTVIVQDTTPPTFTFFPADTTLDCPADTMVATLGMPMATDLCNPVVIITHVDDVTPGVCPNTFTLLRIWAATDSCGLVAIDTQTVIVQDTTPPTFTFFPADTTLECPADTMVATLGMPMATDLCNPVVIITHVDDVTPGACPNTFTLLRIWMATDSCGLIAIDTQTVIVQDTTPPTFTFFPADTTLDCPADTMVATLGMPMATDLCNSVVIITHVDDVTPGACPNTFTLLRIWTATDSCGLIAIDTQTVIVQDTTPPTFTFFPADTTLDCPADTMVATIGMPMATDLCNSVVIITHVDDVTPGACPNTFTLLRIWTATDSCGLIAIDTQTVIVQDTTPPTFTFFPADTTLDCPADTMVATLGMPMATDLCNSVVIITHVDDVTPGACPNTFTLLRIWTATDSCGLIAIDTQTVIVQDTTPPTFTFFPADTTLECPADTMVATLGMPMATDLCNPVVIITHVDNVTPGACPNTFTLLRIWTATDSCGLIAIDTQTVIVQDTTPPTFTFFPADTTLDCPADTMVSTLGMPMATDLCNSVVIITHVDDVTPGACPNTFTLLRIWTATDSCGLIAIDTQTVIVQDTTPPTFTFFPADTTLDCPADTMVATLGMPMATDLCNSVVIITHVDDVTPGACPNTFTLLRIWTATDSCGLIAIDTQTVIVQDTTPPTFTFFPADTTLDCPADTMVATIGMPMATDLCNSVVIITQVDDVTPGACPNTFTLLRIWTATDSCGLIAIDTQTVIVQDTTPPTFTFFPADTTLDCPADTMVATIGIPMATDLCNPVVIITHVDDVTPGACPNTFTLLRIWTATDSCGLIAIDTQTVIVQDTTPPIFTFFPADTTLDCPADTMVATLGMPMATDICNPVVIITHVDDVTAGACPNTFTLLRIWTATDSCGLISIDTQTVIVQDTTPPTFTFFPADTTLDCPADTMVATLGMPMATDICKPVVIITHVDDVTPGACPNTFTLLRIWTATDSCGLIAIDTQTVIVQDTTPPTFTFFPADTTLDCPADTMVSTLGMPMATDLCNSVVIITHVDDVTPGACPNTFILLRIWTATDSCGLIAIDTQTVIVQDTTPPTFTFFPADTTLDCPADTMVATLGMPMATDLCNSVVIITHVDDVTPGACPNTFTLLRIWTATDSCGLIAIDTQTVIVQDTTPPTFTFFPADTTLDCPADTMVATLGMPMATDLCNPVVIITHVDDVTPGACPNTFTLLRIWTATDSCGLIAIDTQTVTVQDTTPPTFTFFPADTTLDCPADTMVATLGMPMATDLCNPVVIITHVDDVTPGACPNTFTLLRIWTATDSCGLIAIDTQTVIVQDTTPPTFTFFPADTTLDCPADTMVATLGMPTATDLCNPVVIITHVDDVTPGACPNTFTLLRIWTATDSCGLIAIDTQTVIVQDTTPPTFTFFPADTTLDCPADTMVATIGIPMATDLCNPGVIITHVDDVTPGACPNTFTLLRIWTATDSCGLIAIDTQTVIVQDTTPPTFTFFPADTTLDCPADTMVATLGMPMATDLCNSVVIITHVDDVTPGACPNTFTLLRIWTATDSCGLIAIDTQTVIVQDTTPPTFTFFPADTTLDCPADTMVATIGMPMATDLCNSVVIITHVDDVTAGACPNTFTLLRIWTATDSCGLIAIDTQTVIVQDTTSPMLTCPTDFTLESSDTTCMAPEYDNVPELENATGIDISDNCTADANIIVSYRDSLVPAEFISLGDAFFDTREVIRTYTFEDACGNINESCPQFITYNFSGCQELETYGRIAVQGTSFFNVSESCDVPPIQVTEVETGVCGYVDYMWLMSTEEQLNGQPYAPNSLNVGTLWQVIPGEIESTLEPGVITENTYYARCVKNFSCCQWKESNIVGYRVTPDGTCPITSPVIVSDCNENIDLRSPTDNLSDMDNWKYESNMNITGNNTVGGGAQLTLDAGTSTVLMPSFQVDTSAVLEVYTDGCNE